MKRFLTDHWLKLLKSVRNGYSQYCVTQFLTTLYILKLCNSFLGICFIVSVFAFVEVKVIHFECTLPLIWANIKSFYSWVRYWNPNLWIFWNSSQILGEYGVSGLKYKMKKVEQLYFKLNVFYNTSNYFLIMIIGYVIFCSVS